MWVYVYLFLSSTEHNIYLKKMYNGSFQWSLQWNLVLDITDFHCMDNNGSSKQLLSLVEHEGE